MKMNSPCICHNELVRFLPISRFYTQTSFRLPQTIFLMRHGFKFIASFDVHFNYLKIIMCNVRCNILIINYFNFMQNFYCTFSILETDKRWCVCECAQKRFYGIVIIFRGLFGISFQNKSFVMTSKMILNLLS